MDSPVRYKEKSVIIHRDENGFGLRVGGQNPVFVDCVHENGAAWKAGVRKDDRIIKVNGTLVRSYDHQRVVHMIQNCSPFVNLTLHTTETFVPDQFTVVASGMHSAEPNKSNSLLNGSSTAANSSSPNNNIIPNSMKTQSLHQRLHNPHYLSSSHNWLLDIGDDLFQDNNQNKTQQQQVNADNISVTPSAHSNVGVSKLIVSGPSILMTNHSQTSGNGKPKLRRNQSGTKDNPYYYYKTAPEKTSGANSINSATTSLLGQDQSNSKSSTSLSIVRSRSSSKMSIRSTTGKYKPRNLRSRLVEDLRSLTITNNQTTPSSLSTSPSSSDLSDCDDQDSSRIDCLSMNTSNSSPTGCANLNLSTNSNSCISVTASQGGVPKPKHTTRRLEIIRELIDTEKTHTERLKHLNDLLYKPIKAEGLVPMEQLKMVFSCHKTLFKIHRKIYKILLAAQQNTSEYHQEPLIGKALVEIFEGELGKRLEKAASTFCACQSTNTELLNRFTRKDTKAGEFLAQVATQQMLGRLGIKDLLASCFQRLTKYPLLLDNLLKATPNRACGIHSKSLSEGSIATSLTTTIVNSPTTDIVNCEGLNSEEVQADEKQNIPNSSPNTSTTLTPAHTDSNNEDLIPPSVTSLEEEYAYERLCINRALHQSRQILIHVNEAVKRAISHNKLRDIWKKTDKYATTPDEFDIEAQQMIHDGPLTLRIAKRTIEVYVLLLTHYILVLTREGQDKYKLKNFTADGKTFSPIFSIDEDLATRDIATDENGFYLLCKKKGDSMRIYELASQSPLERAKWKEKIHMAQLYRIDSAAAPEDDNTLTRYRELISLATSSNTPNNIEHSPTNNNNVNSSTNNNIVPSIQPIIQSTPQSSSSLSDVNTNYTTGHAPSTAHQINSGIGHEHNVKVQDV